MTAQVRAAALLAGVDAHYAREQKAADELASARAWAVALDGRLEAVTVIVHNAIFYGECSDHLAFCRCSICRVYRLLKSELVAE